MSNNSDHQCRQPSSSEDRCKCPQCKQQLELQLHSKKPVSNIYLYRHLKKRQGPPDKKDTNNPLFKQKLHNKPEPDNKQAATPGKHKTDRSKDATLAVLQAEYHMVSHSQRLKIDKEGQPQARREERMRPKVRSGHEVLNLAQVTQNLESIKLESRKAPSGERTRMDASPNSFNLSKVEAPREGVHK